jgi:hypothetical protein
MNLFGFKKNEKRDDIRPKIAEAIKLITETIDTQQKRKIHLERQIDALTVEIKTLITKNKKDTALLLLKKQKMIKKQVSVMDDSIFNLELQKMNLENNSIQKASIDAFKQASSVLKESAVDVEEVERVMDDLQDETDRQQEISEALARPLISIDVDDELAEIEREIAEEADLKLLVAVPTVRLLSENKNKIVKDDVVKGDVVKGDVVKGDVVKGDVVKDELEDIKKQLDLA